MEIDHEERLRQFKALLENHMYFSPPAPQIDEIRFGEIVYRIWVRDVSGKHTTVEITSVQLDKILANPDGPFWLHEFSPAPR